MNDNPCRTPAPPQHAHSASRMPELFGPRPDQYVPQVKLKRWNEIRTPRATTLPGVPAHILRRQLLDIFDALDQGTAVWGHVDDFLEQIPEPYRGQLTMRVASSMCHIERRTGWRMPPEKFCAFLSNLPPHIKTWLTDGDHAFLGFEAFGSCLARAHREALIIGKHILPASDHAFAEVIAIQNGPDAIRAHAAGGGTFTLDLSHTGVTLAHVAATATLLWPDSVAAFIAAGGNFHHRPDRLGRTPAHTLVNEAISPDAIRLTVAAGVRVTADLAVQPDQFGCSIVDSARVRGTEFVEALDALLVVDEGAP